LFLAKTVVGLVSLLFCGLCISCWKPNFPVITVGFSHAWARRYQVQADGTPNNRDNQSAGGDRGQLILIHYGGNLKWSI
jgi:hypothetical protein